MKRILFILAIITLSNCASPSRLLDKKTFTKEIIIKDLPENAEQLFIKANSWMVDVFYNPNSVIEFTDKKQQVLIGKYLLHTTFINGIHKNYFAKIDVRIKKNTIKLKINPFTNITTSKKNAPTEIRNKIQTLFSDFETKMKKKEDW